jgi:hypothetical protein
VTMTCTLVRSQGVLRSLMGAILLASGWLAIQAAASAAELVGIEVFPPQVQLDSMRDRQTLVVQARRSDGVTFDVTSVAEIVVTNPALAAVQRQPRELGSVVRLAPLADGDATIRVTHAGHAVEIPLRVVSATSEPPLSFRLDVMPVFARGGCNMGSCHGAARGKDGFRLSLFGFDPAGDYHRLTREMPGRRIDLGDPAGSLLVQKSIGAVAHTGGKRFELESDLSDRLIRWIAAGAPDDPEGGAKVPVLQRVDLYPPTSLLEGQRAHQQFVAVARFADGTDRDVTDLVWYGSNNDSSAEVSVDGLVTSGSRGEAFIMARYDTITVGVPVVVIPEKLSFTFPKTPGNTWIDDLVDAKLESLRIAPSGICDDETFIRRATLDLIGLVPTPEERASFLADKGSDKRQRLIESLIGRKEFVDL